MTPEEWEDYERTSPFVNNEVDWNRCPVASSLLERVLWLKPDLGPNQKELRLFGCACCRLVWQHLPSEAKQAVEAAECFARGEISEDELDQARMPVVDWLRNTDQPAPGDDSRKTERAVYRFALSASEVSAAEDQDGWPYQQRVTEMPALMRHEYEPFGMDTLQVEAELCQRLRDIFGNPFQGKESAGDGSQP